MKDNTLLARGKQAKILISANGVTLVFPRLVTSTGGNVGKRGQVKGFSRGSARRLRHLLARVDYSEAVAVTLTHPPVITGMRGPEAAFDSLRKDKGHSCYCRSLIWRKEVQHTGTPHFHCILFPALPGDGLVSAEYLVQDWIEQCLAGWDVLEAFRAKVAADMDKAHHSSNRPAIQAIDGTRYLRYILDHQSKHKREQAQTEGRAWGVWHRDKLPLVIPESIALDDDCREVWVIRRLLRKASRYARRKACPFGWKHTRGRNAFSGMVDYFSRSNDGKFGLRLKQYLESGEYLPWVDALDNPGRYFRRQFEHGEE